MVDAGAGAGAGTGVGVGVGVVLGVNAREARGGGGGGGGGAAAAAFLVGAEAFAALVAAELEELALLLPPGVAIPEACRTNARPTSG